MNPTIRAARKSELPEVCDLLALAFDEAAPQMFVNQTERDSTFRLRHARVAIVDGRVAGYVRIFARTMLVRGVPLAAGGIGSVATHADARHSGIATALMRDAIEQLRREGMTISFLFTGIPAFYERLGYRTVREPYFEADASEAAAIAEPSLYDIRPMTAADDRAIIRIRTRAIAGTTGAVVQTLRTLRDARHWLDEDADGRFIAERTGLPVAYLRSRCRPYGHQILEAECLPGHQGAIASLLAATGRRAQSHGESIVALSPDDHPLSTALRTLPATVEQPTFRYPMMVLVFGDDPAIGVAFKEEPLHFWNTDRI